MRLAVPDNDETVVLTVLAYFAFAYVQLGKVKGNSGWVSKIGSLPIDTSPSISFLHNKVYAQRTIARGCIFSGVDWEER